MSFWLQQWFYLPLPSRICTSVLETKIVSSTSVTDIRFKPLSTDHVAGLALQRLVCYEIGWCRCRAIRSPSHEEVWTIGGGSRRGRLEPDSRKRRTDTELYCSPGRSAPRSAAHSTWFDENQSDRVENMPSVGLLRRPGLRVQGISKSSQTR